MPLLSPQPGTRVRHRRVGARPLRPRVALVASARPPSSPVPVHPVQNLLAAASPGGRASVCCSRPPNCRGPRPASWSGPHSCYSAASRSPAPCPRARGVLQRPPQEGPLGPPHTPGRHTLAGALLPRRPVCVTGWGSRLAPASSACPHDGPAHQAGSLRSRPSCTMASRAFRRASRLPSSLMAEISS